MIKTLLLNGQEIEYDLQRKKVKNINLRIKADQSVHVSANRFVPMKVIEEFLISNADYIINAIQKFEKVEQQITKPKQYICGEKFCFLGNEKTLLVEKSDKNYVELNGDNIFLYVKETNDINIKKQTTDKWIKQKSCAILTDICIRIYPEFSKYNIDFPQIKMRKMSSKWGSCRPAQKILTFNTALLEAPVECIEYVVYHEFTHFLVQNHSKQFYDTLENFLPEWKTRRKQLKQVQFKNSHN